MSSPSTICAVQVGERSDSMTARFGIGWISTYAPWILSIACGRLFFDMSTQAAPTLFGVGQDMGPRGNASRAARDIPRICTSTPDEAFDQLCQTRTLDNVVYIWTPRTYSYTHLTDGCAIHAWDHHRYESGNVSDTRELSTWLA